MPYSLDWLLAQPAPKYLFFWGHTPKQPGIVDKSCFSQWFPAAFEVAGETYPTAEHWMMTEKARLFEDEAVRQRILGARHPHEAKKLGRLVQGFEPARWDEVKFNLVVAGNFYKFSQHAELRDYLVATGDRVLVEASPMDAIWGIGLAADHPDAARPASWPGENLLGFALMAVRDQLRAA
ncbi:NADAR family protein [Hymenobacter sp. RP-2-7]|uniref:NADAR family protein n=1 Tax=Hymenobacter polaris TaxID=2682546 RepID=A0A7Y0AIF2_9BACT|nr:NADAR family protein [Hymenobacter polaris]NML67757.1 NADAR family protein [Hymenobacter polaris]